MGFIPCGDRPKLSTVSTTGPTSQARTLVGELVTTAQCLVRYPMGLVEGALTSGRPSGEASHDTPVLLVHGYGHNQSGWWVLDRHLRRAGFTSVHRLNYLPLGGGVPQLAERLSARVEEIRSFSGATRVHVVGHSLGGVLLRWYVQELGGEHRVGTAVTLGSPHEGTLAAYLWPERTARQLVPGSWVVRRLADGARRTPVRWVAVYSDRDLLVQPSSSGRLRDPAMGATNIEVAGLGHLSLLVSARVLRAVTAQLEAAEGLGAPLSPLAARPASTATTPAAGASRRRSGT
jgi:triacylglycerol esterase/lipase EstA (alpha/beta hydrolase family)